MGFGQSRGRDGGGGGRGVKLCSVEGCEEIAICKGWCDGHYSRWKKSGNVNASVPLRQHREKGTGTIHDGYLRLSIDGKLVREHVMLAEKALGKALPPGAQVHHVDENKQNNSPGNLVLCPDDAYHKLLHLRQRAIDECGNAEFRKCQFCGRWSDPSTMKYNSRMFHHAECRRADNARRSAARKES